jgi:hypothetical protein
MLFNVFVYKLKKLINKIFFNRYNVYLSIIEYRILYNNDYTYNLQILFYFNLYSMKQYSSKYGDQLTLNIMFIHFVF